MFVSLQFKLELKREDREKLIKLMRKQSSAIRVAYNMLRKLEKEKTKNPFPYTVELKLRDGEVYGNVSFELPTPEVRYTKEKGVIAIDTNASPIHLAMAEVSKTGELLSYQTISLHHLIGLSQNSKDHQEWILAHQIVDLAIQKGKAIAIENLKKLKKGMRGDEKAELRKRLHQWNAKKFLQKLKRVAMLKGVEVVEVHPAYTSVIGMLKYAPQLSVDKDVAGAYVIGRRALGFKEDMPENYEKLLKDKAYLEFALKRYEEREKKLRELLEKEGNEYKRNTLKSELRSVENARKLLANLIQSLQSEPSSCEGANGRNPEQGRVAKTTLQSAWQVLKVALLFPILGKVLPRDLSPLKPVLVKGVWGRVRRSNGLVPLEAGRTVPIRDF
ncbi:MAG: IS200/IS605 family element transposase accessory protein TnpB [Thermocrinis sp.]|jgi:IS605 OrfB family transposase|nr:IS200/IS605 family element transposase accessory protein TnpB [Thermocrinis sp.]